MKAITLSLSGGASRGAYQLGVLQFIDENNIEVKAISATSIGAIIGASYASGVSPKKQLEIFKSKEFRKVISFNFFRGSIFKLNADAPILDELVLVKRIEDLPIDLYINAVDIHKGEEIYFDHGDIKTVCLAASALVPFFQSVKYKTHDLVDGGAINHMPVKPLRSYELPIVGVNLHPIYYEEKIKGLIDYTKRAMFLSTYRNSITAKQSCDIYITSPKLKDYNMFSFKHLDEMFAMGYEDAKCMFNEALLQ